MTEQNITTRLVLRALVIMPNPKTQDMGSLLAIARSEACRREHTQQNPPIRALRFFPELSVYVAVYEADVIRKTEVNKPSG